MNPFVFATLYSLVGLALLTVGGNWLCRLLFKIAKLTPPVPQNAQEAGWLIGILERLVLAIGIVTHSWEVLAAVVALKTVSRFKELDEQHFAEYFLVGSLFSVLWAVLITSAWLMCDHALGIDMSATISALIEPPTAG